VCVCVCVCVRVCDNVVLWDCAVLSVNAYISDCL
jgi:hypothetical protein